MEKKIVLGLSGGVDSASAAYILKQDGYQVYGLFLSYKNADSSPAVRAAQELDIPLKIIDITSELEEKVICPFVGEYLGGKTPNPCIVCNPTVKFRAMIDYADEIGAEFIATGHYAGVRDGHLYASNSPKDQSYMLYRLPPEYIRRCVFPLDVAQDKDAVRAIARDGGLSSQSTPDSMEICFIPNDDHAAFIESRGVCGKAGNFVTEGGEIIAPHGGIHKYTVGQRRGLGIASTGRLYVSDIDAESGDVTLSLNDPKGMHVFIDDLVFTNPEYRGLERFDCHVRVRHSRAFAKGVCTPAQNRIDFESPVRALSPGQSAVCYGEDGMVICGGFIKKDNEQESL